jgi:transcriptional regulator NrdR family protein
MKGTVKVLKTRRDTVETVLRLRECQPCKHRWWTVEVELPPSSVKWVYDSDPDRDNFGCYPSRKKGSRRIQVTFS